MIIDNITKKGNTHMKRFIILYKGPATPPDASHQGWPEWFGGLGDKLIDKGHPLLEGWSVGASETNAVQAAKLNGYSIIQANDSGEARSLLASHPYIALGADHTIELYEIPVA